MADNLEVLSDGVKVYPAVWPQNAKDILEETIQSEPGLSNEDAVNVTILKMAELARLATQEHKPDAIVA